jgi:hypothetical protein
LDGSSVAYVTIRIYNDWMNDIMKYVFVLLCMYADINNSELVECVKAVGNNK